YEWILQNIVGLSIIVNCTITNQRADKNAEGARQLGYFEEFLSFWSARPEVRKIWFSLFTPQVGEEAAEILTADERESVLKELMRLRPLFPKMYLPDVVIQGYRRPSQTPDEGSFGATTFFVTA